MATTTTPLPNGTSAADKATAVAEQVVSGLKTTGDQVLSTVRQSGELAFEVAQSWIDLAVNAAPKFTPAQISPSRADLQDLLSASFAPVEKLFSLQRKTAGALLDAIVPAR